MGYAGPRDPEALWKDGNFAFRATIKVSTSRVARTRPMFSEWATQCEGVIDESQLDLDQLGQIAENAGAFVGLGDWRPRFGRFTAKVEAR